MDNARLDPDKVIGHLRNESVSGPAQRRKCMSARSNAPRGIMFTAPASADPGLSGVGEKTTSTRARLLIESMSSDTDRAVPPPGFADATLKPSIVTGT